MLNQPTNTCMMKNLFLALFWGLFALSACSDSGNSAGAGAAGNVIRVSDTLLPYYENLRDLQVMQLEMQQLTTMWVANQRETPSKAALRSLVSDKYTALKRQTLAYGTVLAMDERKKLDEFFRMQDTCITDVSEIMAFMNDSAAYEEPGAWLQMKLALADDNSLYNDRVRKSAEMLRVMIDAIEPKIREQLQAIVPKK